MKWRYLLVVGPYLALVIVGFLGFRILETQRNTECDGRRDGREVLRELVVQATSPGQSVDLTKVPGFDGLDEATQVYLENVSASLNRGTPSDQQTVRDRLLALVPPIDC